MQRWLYLLAEFGSTRELWRLRTEDGLAQVDWKKGGPILFDYLKDQGHAGWELVTAVKTAEDRLDLIFKKHRSD